MRLDFRFVPWRPGGSLRGLPLRGLPLRGLLLRGLLLRGLLLRGLLLRSLPLRSRGGHGATLGFLLLLDLERT